MGAFLRSLRNTERITNRGCSHCIRRTGFIETLTCCCLGGLCPAPCSIGPSTGSIPLHLATRTKARGGGVPHSAMGRVCRRVLSSLRGVSTLSARIGACAKIARTARTTTGVLGVEICVTVGR